MSHKSAPPTVSTIGIDLGKNSFHLVGLDQRGAIVWQLKCSRAQLERRLANIPCCLIGMEACSGAHYIARQLAALGDDVRLIPAQYVKPFLKGHKNDYRDAEAIAAAVQRPTMHFVAIKTPTIRSTTAMGSAAKSAVLAFDVQNRNRAPPHTSRYADTHFVLRTEQSKARKIAASVLAQKASSAVVLRRRETT